MHFLCLGVIGVTVAFRNQIRNQNRNQIERFNAYNRCLKYLFCNNYEEVKFFAVIVSVWFLVFFNVALESEILICCIE